MSGVKLKVTRLNPISGAHSHPFCELLVGDVTTRDATFPKIDVRPATLGDRERLVDIRSKATVIDSDEFVHHLGIPEGDDYFCLVAEIDHIAVGYLSAGGSRDDDHKAYGEFYEFGVDHRSFFVPVLEHLIDRGWERMVTAQFGGVIVWVDRDDDEILNALSSRDFVPDDHERSDRDGLRRFGRVAYTDRLGTRRVQNVHRAPTEDANLR